MRVRMMATRAAAAVHASQQRARSPDPRSLGLEVERDLSRSAQTPGLPVHSRLLGYVTQQQQASMEAVSALVRRPRWSLA